MTAAAYRNAVLLDKAFSRYREAADKMHACFPRGLVAPLLEKSLARLEQAYVLTGESAAAVGREWNRTRHPDDRKKDNSSPRIRQRGGKALLPTLLKSRDFLGKLTGDFKASIAAYSAGGDFPA